MGTCFVCGFNEMSENVGDDVNMGAGRLTAAGTLNMQGKADET